MEYSQEFKNWLQDILKNNPDIVEDINNGDFSKLFKFPRAVLFDQELISLKTKYTPINTSKNIDSGDIIDIRLLSEDEVDILPRDIRWTGTSYWTQTPKSYNCRFIRAVSRDGRITDSFTDSIRGVRPILEVKNSKNLNLYDIVELLNEQWYYIGDNKLLSTTCLFEYPFNKIEDNNNYNESDVKKKLKKWLEDKLQEYK